MPIYEYQCDKCGHEFEREQRIVEDPIKTCPACKARRVKRLISRTSFVLKGGGWYGDLYSSKGGKKSDDADAKRDSTSDAATTAKAGSDSSSSDSSSSDSDAKASKSDAKSKQSPGSEESKQSGKKSGKKSGKAAA